MPTTALNCLFIFSLRQSTHNNYDKEVTNKWLDDGFYTTLTVIINSECYKRLLYMKESDSYFTFKQGDTDLLRFMGILKCMSHSLAEVELDQYCCIPLLVKLPLP